MMTNKGRAVLFSVAIHIVETGGATPVAIVVGAAMAVARLQPWTVVVLITGALICRIPKK